MITRFAPSPTGPLHLGHAYSALTVWQVAKELGGTALLRIEDTDSTRVRPEFETGIYEDLTWLGLRWPEPVLRQSQHNVDYSADIQSLSDMGLIYPCRCTRRDIIDAGAQHGVEGMIYPGTCRTRTTTDKTPADALRLNLARARDIVQAPLRYTEIGQDAGDHTTSIDTLIATFGDPVLQRKDTGDHAYHLACVQDDARQEITHVVRGTDLQVLTPLHVLLQKLLGYPTPIYHHHGLITDDQGKRLAKIDKSKSIAKYRAESASPADIKRMIGWVD